MRKLSSIVKKRAKNNAVQNVHQHELTAQCTIHKIFFADATSIRDLGENSVDLVVTSPPYPMISMWDSLFSEFDPNITNLLYEGKGKEAFESMHNVLDRVWESIFYVLKNGGIACINIGDSARTLNGEFRLYSSHSRILNHCREIGFSVLPGIIWKKPTNSPNKFLGSGMLPTGAYVTLGHEHILVLRKGNGRKFENEEQKSLRNDSAFFWEERNEWFSDVWNSVNGTRQDSNAEMARARTGAFPFEVAYRLVNMFSVRGDLVLDPFLGTGTTSLASLASGRNSLGFEISKEMSGIIDGRFLGSQNWINEYTYNRLKKHTFFMGEYQKNKKKEGYSNPFIGSHVVTSQERALKLYKIESIEKSEFGYTAEYGNLVSSSNFNI